MEQLDYRRPFYDYDEEWVRKPRLCVKEIPKDYQGVDRLYGDMTLESLDYIIDLIDEYVELVEAERSEENARPEN